jgi:hypothetical protein
MPSHPTSFQEPVEVKQALQTPFSSSSIPLPSLAWSALQFTKRGIQTSGDLESRFPPGKVHNVLAARVEVRKELLTDYLTLIEI